MKKSNKQKLQEKEYNFPYHYLNLVEKHRLIPYTQKIDLIKRIIIKLKPKKVADLGCGDAFLINQIKNNVAKIKGYDFSKRALAFAKAFNPEIEFSVLDIAKDKLNGSFDLIVVLEILEHIKKTKLAKTIENIYNSLKEDSYLIITVPSKKSQLSSKHYQHFSVESMRENLCKYFKIKEVVGLNNRSVFWQYLFDFMLFITNLYYPFSFTKLNGLYSFFLKITNKIYQNHLLKSDVNSAKTLLFICTKKL